MTLRTSLTIAYPIPPKAQIAKSYATPLVGGRGGRYRVAAYGGGIPMNPVGLNIGSGLPACERPKLHVPTKCEGKHVPAAASAISKTVVMRENKRTAETRTVPVGQRFIKGAMRIAPTH